MLSMESNEPLYTREEWEEIQQEEWRQTRRAFNESGGVFVNIVLSGEDIRRQPDRAALLSLIDVKLQQAKLSILEALKEE